MLTVSLTVKYPLFFTPSLSRNDEIDFSPLTLSCCNSTLFSSSYRNYGQPDQSRRPMGVLNYCEISRSITKPRVRRKIKRRDLHQIVTKFCKNWAEYKVALLLNWIYAIAFFWEELKEKKESISRRFGIRHLEFWANTRKPRGWH